MVVAHAAWTWPSPASTPEAVGPFSATAVSPPSVYGAYSGDKFFGGFGVTKLFDLDYWTLRERSSQLWVENTYAKGIIKRLVTNIINTGLKLEAIPEEGLLDLPVGSLDDWSEEIENLFAVWAENPPLCDQQASRTFGDIQRAALTEALIEGDVLVVLRMDPKTKLPKINLVRGSKVRTPFNPPKLRKGHRIVHGVEVNASGGHVAFWVVDKNDKDVRVVAYGEKSGRRSAWLFYGTGKRVDDVRGECLLSACLQPLKEIDRFKDATQRKANLNATLAMTVEKTSDKIGTRPLSGGAVRRSTAVADVGGTASRTFNVLDQIPGVVIEDLQTGEKITSHGSGADVNFGPFEEAIISGIAWALEIPPETLKLAYSSNYAASQMATNEFRMFLNKERTRIGGELCKPIYAEWFMSGVLTGRVKAKGFLQSLNVVVNNYAVRPSWLASDWSGAIKPSADLVKQARGYEMLVAMGAITRGRAARELTGTKFSKNVKTLNRENALLFDAQVAVGE